MSDPNSVQVCECAPFGEGEAPAPAASRLSAACGDCGWSGSRNETFRASSRRGDTFIDKCPGCSSDNVDVYDPMHAEHDA